MEFYDLIDVIVNSDETDWAVVHGGDLDNLDDQGEGNDHRAVYRGDVSIALSWGRSVNEKFVESWTQNFPDKGASSFYVDISWNGNVAHRAVLVLVDGARAVLPLPDKDLNVSKKLAHLAQLIDSLGSLGEFSKYFDMAGFKLTDIDWPRD